MSLQLYNTLHRSKEGFRPLSDGKVGLYTCGPTVYDTVHIGNLRAFVNYDLLRRTLEFKGYDVRHVMNITDVDDRIIQAIRKRGVPREEFTAEYTDLFYRDLDRVGALRAHEYPRATDHVDAMISLIRRLGERGLTYDVDGSIYFSVSKFADYGKLSGMDLDQLRSSGRVAADHYGKEEVRDFALWKAWTEEDGPVAWETHLGKGRPGWHIECSAMSMQYLGETFDLHSGGVDLIFPHHENEIAQSEGATGRPFVTAWVHNEMLLVEGEKMSKSKGNFTILEDIIEKGFDPRHLRYSILQTHYRQPFNFTWKGMEQAGAALRSLDDFRLRLTEARGEKENPALRPLIEKAEGEFEAALDDDLSSPRAIAALHGFVRDANRAGFGAGDRPRLERFLSRVDLALGLAPAAGEAGLSPEEAALLARRQEARKKGDYALADRIRGQLRMMGLEVRDGPSGATWRRIAGAGKAAGSGDSRA